MSIMEATDTKWAATMPIGRIGAVYTFNIKEASDDLYILSVTTPGRVVQFGYDNPQEPAAMAEELMRMFGLKRL